MKKGILGIILSSLGIIGLVLITLDYFSGGASAKNVASLFLCAILGATLFFWGIGLVPSPEKAQDNG